MTFIPGVKGDKDTNNSNNSLNQTGWNMFNGPVVSSVTYDVSGSIVLDSSASDQDASYNGLVLEIVNGMGIHETYIVNNYIGASRTCEIDEFIEILPDSTSTAIIHTYSGLCPVQDQSQQFKTIKLNGTASTVDDFHNQCFIKFFNNGYGSDTARILDYDGTNKICTIDSVTEFSINSLTRYIIIGESGLATDGSSNGITLQASHGHSTVDDFYNGFFIEIYSGTGSGQTSEITDYDGTTRVCTTSWTTAPDSTSQYNIYSGWGAPSFTNCESYTQVTATLVTPPTEHIIIYQQLGLENDNTANRGKYAETNTETPSSVHTLAIVSNYYKIKLVSMGTTMTGNVQILFHTAKNKALTSFVEESINENNDCELVRSVLCGKTPNGRYKNLLTSENGTLNTHVTNPTTAFGEIQVSKMIPVAQINFPYYKNSEMIYEYTNPGTRNSIIIEGDGSTAHVQLVYLPPASLLNQSSAGSYFTMYNATDISQYSVWYNVDENNSDPSGPGVAIEVDVSANFNSSQVATATIDAINAVDTGITASNYTLYMVDPSNNLMQLTNDSIGTCTGVNLIDMPINSDSTINYVKNESQMELTHSHGIGHYAVMSSKRLHKYRPGQGGIGRFTALFARAVLGVQQIAGIGNQVSGFFFGIDPNTTNFGILHRKSGLASIQKLTITGASAGGAATFVIDGVTYTMTLTETTDTGIAREIAESDIFKHGSWITMDVSDSVIFLSETATGSRTINTYSATLTSGTGTWTSITDGTAVVNTWIPQYEWNRDKFNRYDTDGMYLNPTKGNVYQIQYQWLGYGTIKFYIENSYTGGFVLVHEIKYANKNTVPSCTQPAFRLMWATNTNINTTSASMKMASGALFNEGRLKEFDNLFSDTQSVTTTDGNETHLVTYRNERVFHGKGSNSVIIPILLNFANNENKGGVIRVYKGATVTNREYHYINEDNSTLTYTTAGTVTGGTLRFTLAISGDSDEQIDLKAFDNLLLHPADTLSFTVQRSTTTNVNITSVMTWHEDQ